MTTSTATVRTASTTYMGLAIAAAVIGVLFGGLIGAIPAAVAISNARKARDGLGHEYATKARTWAIVAIVLSAVIFAVQLSAILGGT